MPARTSDDLPLPEVPTTARNRFVRSSCKQRRGLLLAAEEQVVLVAAKRAEAGKRIGTRGVNGFHQLGLLRLPDGRDKVRQQSRGK